MQTFSYSAIHFSKADEEKELNEVTDVEKEEILDDKYGRRKGAKYTDNNSHDNDNDDITDEMLEKFHEAIEELPSDVSGMFWRACLEADDNAKVAAECDPALFLRCENYDPNKAALRICEYWNTRYEIFGEENAFKPMTLDGAMKDVILFMMQHPNFLRMLPDDDHGRTVFCIDRTGISFREHSVVDLMKMSYFFVHKMLEKQSAQLNGIVMININQTSSWDHPSLNSIRLIAKTWFHALPIKLVNRHNCFSSIAMTLVVPIFKLFMTRYHRLRVQFHNSLNQPKMLSDMEKFGLHRENLPKSIGGKYDKVPSWIDECKYIRAEQRAQNNNNKRQKNTH